MIRKFEIVNSVSQLLIMHYFFRLNLQKLAILVTILNAALNNYILFILQMYCNTACGSRSSFFNMILCIRNYL